jgi:hypothetical protein
MRRLAWALIFVAFALTAVTPAWADGDQYGCVRYNPVTPSAGYAHLYSELNPMPEERIFTRLSDSNEEIEIHTKLYPSSMADRYLTGVSEINAETGKPTITLGELQVAASALVYNTLVSNCPDATGGSIAYSYDSQTGDLQLGSGGQIFGRGTAMADAIAWAQEIAGYPGFAFGVRQPNEGVVPDVEGTWGCSGYEATPTGVLRFPTRTRMVVRGGTFHLEFVYTPRESKLIRDGIYNWDVDKRMYRLADIMWMATDGLRYAVIVDTGGETNSIHACVRSE